MTAAGMTAVTVEWGAAGTCDQPAAECGCRPAVLAVADRLALVHETDAERPVRCPGAARGADEHLRAGLEACADRTWRGCADVLCGSGRLTAPAALRLVRHLLREHSGCLLAGVRLVGGGCVAVSRNGRCLLARGPVLEPGELGWVASLLHAWVASGVQLPPGGPSRLLIRSRNRLVSLGLMER